MGTPSYVPINTVTVNDLTLTNVDNSSPGWVGGTNIILDTFTTIGNIVENHSLRVDSALDAAETLLVALEMPTGWTSSIPNVEIVPIPPIDLSSFPELPEISELPGYEAISWVTQDTSLSSYTSEMWTTLITKVLDGITNGGTGITSVVENALHESNLEKQRVGNEKAFNLGVAEISSRALSFPQYAMQTLANQISIEILKQTHNSANEIEIFLGKLAQENANFMLDKAVIIEGLLRTFWKDYNAAKLARVEVYVQELLGHVKTITDERDGILKLAETQAVVFKAHTEAQKNWYDAISENQKALLQEAALKLQQAESELKAKLDSYIAIKGLEKEIINIMGGVSSNVMASGLNAGNVSVGASSTMSESRSETFGHSESKQIGNSQNLGEDHNINHKGADIA